MVYVIQTAFEQQQDQDETAVPSWSCYCSKAVYKPVWNKPLLSVQWITHDEGQRNCPKHVEFHSQNKFEKLVHLVGFVIREVGKNTGAKSEVCTALMLNTEVFSVVTLRSSLTDTRRYQGTYRLYPQLLRITSPCSFLDAVRMRVRKSCVCVCVCVWYCPFILYPIGRLSVNAVRGHPQLTLRSFIRLVIRTLQTHEILK
jgi:hypothetical protein